MNRDKFNKCLLSGNTPVSMRNYFLAEKWGITANGLRLCEGGELEVQMFILAQMLISIPNVQI